MRDAAFSSSCSEDVLKPPTRPRPPASGPLVSAAAVCLRLRGGGVGVRRTADSCYGLGESSLSSSPLFTALLRTPPRAQKPPQRRLPHTPLRPPFPFCSELILTLPSARFISLRFLHGSFYAAVTPLFLSFSSLLLLFLKSTQREGDRLQLSPRTLIQTGLSLSDIAWQRATSRDPSPIAPRVCGPADAPSVAACVAEEAVTQSLNGVCVTVK